MRRYNGITSMCFLALIFSIGCKQTDHNYQVELNDPHSFSNPQNVAVRHMDLDIAVDFASKIISGVARLQIENKTSATDLYLDSQGLRIEKVTLDSTDRPTLFEVSDPVKYLGQAVRIAIEPGTRLVNVVYRTSRSAPALQWLSPAQTAGGAKPFLFTQSQAILARSWIPCQDSPAVRFTYTARVTTDPDLMAVMSAQNPTTRSPDGVYQFRMTQAIPAYLMALAIGDLAFKQLGPRSGVYAEPSVLEKAAYEFEDTEKMITAAEKLYGPYRWERYDILVLPPSFPFGGMENPRLTFATPTVLAGDKSLVSLVAHELAHSWSGNLVTNANWNDFWLNEGFTTYFEHRIMEEIYGETYAKMLASLSYQDLEDEIERLGPESPETHLYLNLAGQDPDEGMNAVAYDKGHFFLRTLEKQVGRERWDEFLRSYFNRFAFQSMTTEVFLSYLRHNLIRNKKALEKKLAINSWVYGPGIPPNAAPVQSNEFAKVEAELNAWLSGTPASGLDVTDWTTQHWLHFLRALPADSLSQQQMQELDATFHFSASQNSEILNAWLVHVIEQRYSDGYAALEGFLLSMGRRKFLKPLYKKMSETSGMREMAKLIYAKARPTYHPISVGTIDGILK